MTIDYDQHIQDMLNEAKLASSPQEAFVYSNVALNIAYVAVNLQKAKREERESLSK